MTAIQILDKVLHWFAMDIDDFVKTPSQSANQKISKSQAITEIGRCYKELNTVDFLMYADLIVDKLERDGYLKNENGLYSITFEGKIFDQQKGYEQKMINQKAQNILVANLEKRQKRYELNQTLLLTLVAVGTLVAAFYYLIEIGKHLHWW